MMTEMRWPLVILSANVDACQFGLQPKLAHDLRLLEVHQNRPEDWVLPLNRQFERPLRRLREAMTLQHRTRREAAGLGSGDGGLSLWPIYMDLLWWMCSARTVPLDDGESGCEKVPILYQPAMRRLSDAIRDVYFGSFYATVLEKGWPARESVRALYHGCHLFGVRHPTDWVYDLVHSWDSTVRPPDLPSMKQQEEQLRELRDAYALASSSARQRFLALGVLEAKKPGGPKALVDRLAKARLIRPAQILAAPARPRARCSRSPRSAAPDSPRPASGRVASSPERSARRGA